MYLPVVLPNTMNIKNDHPAYLLAEKSPRALVSGVGPLLQVYRFKGFKQLKYNEG